MTSDAVVAGARRRGRLIATSEGLSHDRFTPTDWVLLLIPATIWGSSFLLIAIGLESLAPTTITWLRFVFGFAALSTLPATRRTQIDRQDLVRIALVGVVWMAFPMSMFPLAEQWIDSSVTGMLNGALPLFSAAIAVVLLHRRPGRSQVIGLLIGFGGVVLVSLPSLRGTPGTAFGATLVVVAMLSYGLATNLVVPLQQKYGSLPVIWRAQASRARAHHAARHRRTPVVVVGLAARPGGGRARRVRDGVRVHRGDQSDGRVGATRGSVLAYLIPVVAIVLGVVVRDEAVALIALVGTGFVLAGAWLTTRAGR